MNWLGKLFSSSGGNLIESIGNTVDRFVTTKEEKAKLKLELETLLQKRDSEIEETIRAELGAKERIIVAELNQGDNYTKRARPTVVYMGLAFIMFNYCIVPALQIFLGMDVQTFHLPDGFWLSWGGIVGTYSVGRTMEKRGVGGGVTEVITGRNPNKRNLLDL